MSELDFDVSQGIATITLNRPEKRNAFNTPMLRAWTAALEESQARDDVRAIVLTGAGQAFCSGGDVGGMKDRFHTSTFADLGGGLLAKMPALGGLTVFAAIASLGLPGLAGFWGEMLAMLGSYRPDAALSRPLFVTLMAVAGLGTVLTAVYFLFFVLMPWYTANDNERPEPARVVW